MNRRSELRFQIYTSARITLFDEPEREIEAQMVDVSASGIRFITDVEFPEDQIVIVETDQYLILADIRNCKARGIRFGVGAERVHSTAKFGLPRSSSKTERNQALIADYHRRLQEELEKPVVPGTSRAPGAAARFAPEAEPPKVDAGPVALEPASGESSAPVDAAFPVIAPPPAWKWRTMAFVALSAAAILLISLPGLLGNRGPAAPSAPAAKTSQEPALVVDSVVPAATASVTPMPGFVGQAIPMRLICTLLEKPLQSRRMTERSLLPCWLNRIGIRAWFVKSKSARRQRSSRSVERNTERDGISLSWPGRKREFEGGYPLRG
ncbi:MAG: PilZ domain-containing protein [Bryobacterales bacterium]|nr:PilZ domain-containing protein [Bryobacterales bacterium]